MDNHTETNFGWWADKPERQERPSQFAASPSSMAPLKDIPPRSPWREILFIVAIFLTLGIAAARLF